MLAPFTLHKHNPDVLTCITSHNTLRRYGLYDTVIAIDEQTTA